MDLKKYDELRKKINVKDFEGSNKGLDKWLFNFSYVGNISAIFFAYFLVYPSLLKAITFNLLSGFFGTLIAFVFTLIFLSMFEITKRYFIRNFSNEYLYNNKKIKKQTLGWFIGSFIIIALSFYLSISGSKNLATTSTKKDYTTEIFISKQVDSLTATYEKKMKIYWDDNDNLTKINNEFRRKLLETTNRYSTVVKDYQTSIDNNVKVIESNKNEIEKIKLEFDGKVNELKSKLTITKNTNKTEDTKNIWLFIIIVIANEFVIILGLGFRENFEHRLFEINKLKYEKIYQKKDRYQSLLTFIYSDGKLTSGDKVISGTELKEVVLQKSNIQNSNKVVEEFLHDLDRLGITETKGKRRFIVAPYPEAIAIIDKFDDAFRVLENMK